MNKDLINSAIIDNISIRAVDGFRNDLSSRSVFSGILNDVRRLDKTVDSVAELNNTLSKIYDVAQLKIEFLNEPELYIAHKELTEFLGLLAVDGFERLLGYQVRWLLQNIEARLNKLEKLADLLAPLNRENLIETLVSTGWEHMSMRDLEHYYRTSQREYYATLRDEELLDLRDEDEEVIEEEYLD